jgi:thioredoxin reductase
VERAEKDVSIIGGGPTGLFAAFYAGMRGASARIIDSLPHLGGQLVALYPEKYIYDVGGYPKIQARDLAEACIEQAMRFEPEIVLDEEIRDATAHSPPRPWYWPEGRVPSSPGVWSVRVTTSCWARASPML